MRTGKYTLTLSNELMREMREIAPPRGLSKMVNEAIEAYLELKRKKKLEEELKAGYLATNKQSLQIAEEWFPTGATDWLKHVPPYEEGEEFHAEATGA